jgi:hypothetical protein
MGPWRACWHPPCIRTRSVPSYLKCGICDTNAYAHNIGTLARGWAYKARCARIGRPTAPMGRMALERRPWLCMRPHVGTQCACVGGLTLDKCSLWLYGTLDKRSGWHKWHNLAHNVPRWAQRHNLAHNGTLWHSLAQLGAG